jgi:hypothetical protein
MEIDGGRMRYLRAGAGPPLILLRVVAYSFVAICAACLRLRDFVCSGLVGSGLSDRPRGIDHSMRATAGRVVSL